MELKNAIKGRKSIRDFKPDPVPRELIEQALDAAIDAPSNSNRQPWEFVVVCGQKLKELASKLEAAVERGRKSGRELLTWDDKYPAPEEGQRRAKELMRGMMESAKAAGISPAEFIRSNFRFFGAPCMIVVVMNKGYGPGSLLSIGAAVENLLLKAYELGLGTCWMMIPLEYSDALREAFDLPQHKYIVSTIAVGYPKDSKITRFKSSRDPREKFVNWFE